ncbi:MAG: hypothetical protein AB7N76_27760 [Planctomycetota bacterium]
MSQDLFDAFEDLRGRYKPGVLSETLVFYFSLGEDEGQKWTATLGPELMEVERGKREGADVFLKMEEALFLSLIRGEYKPTMMDFMSQRIRSNDPFKLTLLKDLFER